MPLNHPSSNQHIQSWVVQLMHSCFLIKSFKRVWNFLSYVSVELSLILNHYSESVDVAVVGLLGKAGFQVRSELRFHWIYQGQQVLPRKNQLCTILVKFNLNLIKIVVIWKCHVLTGRIFFFRNSTNEKYRVSLEKCFEKVQRLKLTEVKNSAVEEKVKLENDNNIRWHPY